MLRNTQISINNGTAVCSYLVAPKKLFDAQIRRSLAFYYDATIENIAFDTFKDAYMRFNAFNQRMPDIPNEVMGTLKRILFRICCFDNKPYLTFLSDSAKIRFSFGEEKYILDFDYCDDEVCFVTDERNDVIKEVKIQDFIFGVL